MRSLPIAPLHLALPSGPCCAACEPSVLWVIESSCSCWAEVRVLQSAPQPRTEHTGIPPPHLSPQHETLLFLALSTLAQLQINPFFLSPSPVTLSVASSQSLISLSERDFTKKQTAPNSFRLLLFLLLNKQKKSITASELNAGGLLMPLLMHAGCLIFEGDDSWGLTCHPCKYTTDNPYQLGTTKTSLLFKAHIFYRDYRD